MIATYIQELLATNNRVIVPNYGAFLVRATSKSKDANTLKEKLKDIYFSPFLKFNDELLEKYIIKKEGITKEQAAEKITQFIDNVKKMLEQEKPYEIKDFGKFIADKQGKVQFVTIAKEEADNVKEEKKTEPKAPAESVKKDEVKETPKREETKTAPKKESKLKEFEPVKKESASNAKKEQATEDQKQPKQQPITPPSKPAYSYKKEKKPVNKGLIWAIAIGVPLAAVFIWALLNFNTIKKALNKNKTKTEQTTKNRKTAEAQKQVKETGNINKQEKQEAGQVKEKTNEQQKSQLVVQKTKPHQKKYYIIAGSFKNEKNAVNYLNKLKAEGYKAEKLAERNGMHAVSFNSFTDKRKAIAEYKYLAKEKGLQAWILYY